jgi:hypothetical protein
VAARLMPARPPADPERLSARPAWPWWDLPARAFATVVLVLVVTGAAARLGPTLTGVLAPFPIATSVVATFTLAERGHPATVVLLRGVLHGLTGFATFCFLLAMLLVPAGPFTAFAGAVTGAIVVQLTVRIAVARISRPAASALAATAQGR